MITLITGIPGMGKTALLVSLLMEYEAKAERPIFVMGIPDLKLEHIVAPPVAEWTELRRSPEDPTLELAYFTFPPNSILVVDEAQRLYRPRASSSKVPPYVAALETHRHTGLDIILLSQKPKLLDMNVRELVGKHIHIRAGLLGRMLFEWPHIADGESRLDRQDASRRRFSPPKKAFSKYKSAELHTKHKFRIHNAWFLLAGSALFTGYMGWSLYDRVSDKIIPKPEASAVPEGLPLAVRTRAQEAANPSAGPMPLIEALTPTDPQNPLSAPLYAPVAPPVVAPQIVGCIASKRACACYSQQQTPVWLPEEQCRQRAAGAYYDPYRQPMPPSQEGTMLQTTARAFAPATEAQPAPASEMPAAML